VVLLKAFIVFWLVKKVVGGMTKALHHGNCS